MQTKKREKKNEPNCENNRIHNYSNRVYLHGYCSMCANIHSFRMTDVGSYVA